MELEQKLLMPQKTWPGLPATQRGHRQLPRPPNPTGTVVQQPHTMLRAAGTSGTSRPGPGLQWRGHAPGAGHGGWKPGEGTQPEPPREELAAPK